MRPTTFGIRRITLAIATVLGVSGIFVMAPAGAEGLLPDEDREQRGPIRITSDAGFTPENGIRAGSGTKSDPYVISDWDVSSITIADTGKYLAIRDNAISGTLRLNWNGDRLTVVNNAIGDLRVNENVKRTGGPTSGRIANNKIGFVGQLRHWDGSFERNIVGDPNAMNLPFFADRAVNFDGFNGARFRNNTIYGYVDVRLHGHHHGSAFGEGHSHNHAATGSDYAQDEMDHTQRYHEVWVTNNKIYAPGYYYALRYYDTGHAANDRTANSEPNKELNKPHTHYTRVHLNDNELAGGLEVDVFNAQDNLHKVWARGMVELRGNKITLVREALDTFEARDGISVVNARYLTLQIVSNEVRTDFSGDPTSDVFGSGEAGIRLDNLDQADVFLSGNEVYDLGYGIYARRMSKSVNWWITEFRTGNVEQDVYYDNSVENEPERRS